MHLDHAVILTIDDEQSVRRSIAAYLEDYDYTVLEASTGQEGLDICRRQHVDLVLLDVRMPGAQGLDILKELRGELPGVPVVMISGAGNVEDVVTALRFGAQDYLMKPIGDMGILKHAVDKGLEHARLARENAQYQNLLEIRVQEKTHELAQLNNRLRGVVESTRKFFGCGTIEESGRMVLEEFATHMGANGGSLYRVEEQGLRLIETLSLNPPPALLEFPLKSTSVFAHTLETKEAVVVKDINTESYLEPCGATGYTDTSFAIFPLVDHDGEVLDLIALYNKTETPFRADDREVGAVLASCVSEALQTANALAALKRSEELMLHAQKRDAIGTLAGGIAHDFNNILSAIVGYTDLIMFNKTCSPEVRANLEHVQKASQRARDLVRQILSLSRAEPVQEFAVELSPIILEALNFVRASIPSSIAIQHDVRSNLGNVLADPSRIHQIVMNLCTNSAHAMQAKGGVLDVSYTKVDKASEPFNLLGINGDQCLRLSIADNGIGIRDEVVEKIFDPYFTTKGKGEGTGLGLAVVQGIIDSLGGTVKVKSSYGKGSAFHVYFPLAVKGAIAGKEPLEPSLVPGDERILFVDDEATLAEMAGQMLGHLGYRTTIYTDSTKALEHFTKNPLLYDLVITDLTMPLMSGVEFAREITAVRSDIPVVLHTGYSTMIDAGEARAAGVRSFMIKPLSMAKLSRLVRDVLDGK